ncbi:MAG: ATP-binding cassette domain-containing protein [Sneathiella sp.]|nr:ATP-binding cassette domain-containing protein [Sneathiella sp.]
MSFEIPDGSLTAIIGPNGCGKSTLFNLICGAERPQKGQILFEGADITTAKPEDICKMGIGRKFQNPSVFDEMTVLENLRLPALRLQNAPTSAEMLSLIGLTDRAADQAGSLSHGEKQWLEIAMVLMQRPKLLLLDEPTAGMTVAETRKTADIIKTLNREDGMTIMVIEHDVRFIELLECPVMVLAGGEILKSGSFTDISNDDEVRELYFGRRREVKHA